MSSDLAEVANCSFDYVVIGGGTSGLTVAGRLAEHPEISVLVLEAGQDRSDDSVITVPGQFGAQFGNPNYDWQFKTVAQENANGQIYAWPRGKLLGGSSSINFLMWTRPPAHDIDAWEELGNPGWNWNRYFEYSKKSEKFTPPPDEIRDEFQLLYNVSSHGSGGPLSTSYAGQFSAVDVPIKETWRSFGFQPSKDPYGGDPIGFYSNVSTMDPIHHTRSTSAKAFYIPNKTRSNFKVLGGAIALRLITSGEDGNLVAESVEFEFEGKVHIVHARKEVVLSAGTLKTPQILELSGIGNRSILDRFDIHTKIHLPGVGENLQEHFWSQVIFEIDAKQTIETLDSLTDPDFAAEQMRLFIQEKKGLYRLAISCLAFVPLKFILSDSEAKQLVAKKRQRIDNNASISVGLKEQYEVQLKILESGCGADIEITHIPNFISNIETPEPGKKYITIGPIINHPFSRGHVHIVSADPHVDPIMDPCYFRDEFDLQILIEAIKFARRMGDKEPLKGMIAKEVVPGPSCVTDEDFRDYCKKALSTAWHTTGSASMLPREKIGVVDNHLKVYGTRNIRVVDISVVPLQVAAHTQATAYSIAEQAADIILGKLTL